MIATARLKGPFLGADGSFSDDFGSLAIAMTERIEICENTA